MGFIYTIITVFLLFFDVWLHSIEEFGSIITIILLMIVIYRLHKLSDLLQGGEDED